MSLSHTRLVSFIQLLLVLYRYNMTQKIQFTEQTYLVRLFHIECGFMHFLIIVLFCSVVIYFFFLLTVLSVAFGY